MWLNIGMFDLNVEGRVEMIGGEIKRASVGWG